MRNSPATTWIRRLAWLSTLLLVFCFSAIASDDLIQTGDLAYKNRKEEVQARIALQNYREAFALDKHNSDAGWRLSMACYFVGLRLTPDSETKRALFAEGRDAAQTSLRSKPGCAECHFWMAINMALYGQEVGAFKMLFTLNDVKEHLNKTIEINPHYASAGAYRLLGAISQKLPGILGGSNSEAKKFFEQAIRVAPDEPLNYLFMARLLDEEYNDRAGALKIARAGAQIENLPLERLESLEAKAELSSWYEKFAAR